MDSLSIETSSSLFSAPDHISSFLEDFQDKNAHLFPSSDLSFEVNEVADSSTTQVCGKRKRDSSYDSFSGWTEDLLSGTFGDCDNEIFSSDTLNTPVSAIKKEPVSHVDKKRKLSEDEDLSLFITDASSRSPPFHALDFDLESVPVENILAPSNPEASLETLTSVPGAPPCLTNVLNIISNTDTSVCNAMFESLSRIANKFETGKSPISVAPGSSPLEQIEVSQDYLSMQTLFGMAMRPPTVVKPEQQYYPVTAAGIPFMMNGSYAVPNMSMKVPVQDLSAYGFKQSYANTLYSNACSKNMVYPPAKYLSPQTFTPMSMPTQNIYSQPASRVL